MAQSVSSWVWIWLLVSTLIVMYDLSFLVLRPMSLEGGELSQFYSSYNDLFIHVDPGYADMSDGFTLAQGLFNIPEAFLALLALASALVGSYRKAHAYLLIQSSFVLWKTVLYVSKDVVVGFPHAWNGPLSVPVYFAIFSTVLPWLVVPLIIMFKSFNELTRVENKKLA